VQIRGHEIVVREIGMRAMDAIDLFELSGSLNENRASPNRIHKIPLNVVCDKVRGLLP